MKITIGIDCTPDEARAFFGLPALAPLQAAMLKTLEKRFAAETASLDPKTVMANWLTPDWPGLEAMQKALWATAGKTPEKG